MKSFKIQERITERDEIINRYFNDLKGRQYEPLDIEEELSLSRNIQKGCQRSLDKLVRANMRFVISVAKTYQGNGINLSDLISEGNIGLIKAAHKYDDTKGYKFISYAVWWIRQQIMQSLSDNAQQIRMPLNQINLENKLKKAVTELATDGFEPSHDMLADHLGISVKDVENCYANNTRNVVSLNKPANDSDSNDNLTVENTLTGDFNSDTLTDETDNKTEVNVMLSKLNSRNQKIINHLFGLNGFKEKSMSTLADEFNMTSERVRQLKVESIKQMREIMCD